MDKNEVKSAHGGEKFDREYYKRFFDRFSAKELTKYVRWADGWIRFLDNYIDIENGAGRNVLELGASLGYFSRIFKDRGFEVVASDISSYIVKKAKKNQKGIDFKVVDAEKRIDVEGNFNYIVAFEVLEHLKDPQKALKNIFGKLKKDGTLVFSTPFPTKRSLSDPTHINVHESSWWLNVGKKTCFRKRKLIHATFIPFLYRISSIFSWGFPLKTNIPFVNSTTFFIFEK